MLSLAESVLGFRRHLSAYSSTGPRSALSSLEFAGDLLEIAVRLRGSGVSSATRVDAIAESAGVNRILFRRQILPTLDQLDLVDLQLDTAGELVYVAEKLPSLDGLVRMAPQFLQTASIRPHEKALLKVFTEATKSPLTKTTAIELALDDSSGAVREEDVLAALGHLQALGLLLVVTVDDGTEIVYNPKIWASDRDYSLAALKAEDGTVRANVTALIEEVSQTPGIPEDRITSVPTSWINFAVSQGLVQRSSVVTTGDSKNFLFTPHLSRDPFGASAAETLDPSGHVRQLIGSMVYAQTFAEFKLYSPGAFLRRLIRDGEAGNASSIDTDYPMLETSGIIRVEPASRYSKMVLLQADIAEAAIEYIEGSDAGQYGPLDNLGGQRGYVDPDRSRAMIATAPLTDARHLERLVSALRDTVRRGGESR